jgi:hypothetical protein
MGCLAACACRQTTGNAEAFCVALTNQMVARVGIGTNHSQKAKRLAVIFRLAFVVTDFSKNDRMFLRLMIYFVHEKGRAFMHPSANLLFIISNKDGHKNVLDYFLDS